MFSVTVSCLCALTVFEPRLTADNGKGASEWGKDFERALSSPPEMAAFHHHPHWCPAPSKHENFRLEKLHDWANSVRYLSGLCQHWEVLGSFRAFQKLPIIWHKDKLVELCRIIFSFIEIKFNETKNSYFIQALITLTGTASKINTSFL